MLLSICIPCFKRVKELRKTLQSIYIGNADVELDEFEVVISDNDPDCEAQKMVSEFKYPNLRYISTQCEGFMNSYHVLTYAKGEFLKLHNSQSLFRNGALKTIINDIHKLAPNKSLIFYTNGMLNKNRAMEFADYNKFMHELSYWSSWSNGFCIWREQLSKVEQITLNKLFPHTSIFLTIDDVPEYYINDQYLFDVQRIPKRGGHNKFAAFTLEYPSLIDTHFQQGKITESTRNVILRDIMMQMLPNLLFNKYIAKIENFDISGYHKNIKRYFPWYAYWLTFLLAPFTPIPKIYNRCKRINLSIKS